MILVPEKLVGPDLHFFTFSDGLRLPVTFRESDEGPELLFERYKLRGVGV